MEKASRRQFIKSCLYLSASGLGFGLLTSLNGCGGGGFHSSQAKGSPPQGGKKSDVEPAYLKLHRSGELKRRGEGLWGMLGNCNLCPRECGVDRLNGERGYCQASSRLEISSFHPHFGEARALVGKGGSGTIFFTHCGLRCVYCKNWEISQGGKGEAKGIEDLAAAMLKLQRMGCHNIHLVTPAHYSPHLVLATDMAASRGLRLPLIYHTSGWERPLIINQLNGVIDIYLSGFKYARGKAAAKYSSDAKAYPEVAKASLLEMQRQVGTARPAGDGLISRGLMIEHVVLPNRVSGTREIARWISENLPKDTYFMILSGYIPTFQASGYPDISRRITREEYGEALGWVERAGLTNLEVQGYGV